MANHRTKPGACLDCGAPLVFADVWLATPEVGRAVWKSWGWRRYGGRGFCVSCIKRKKNRP